MIRDPRYEVLRDSELVAIREGWEKRLSPESLKNTPVMLSGIVRGGAVDMYRRPGQRVDEALEELAELAEALRDPDVFRPLCVDAGLHGVHFVDKLFGAEVYELDGRTGNWQARCLKTPVGGLRRPDMARHPTWSAARQFAVAFVAAGVSVPVLMLPTISSALNVGLNLYGEELLVAMLADPEAAKHDLEVINSVLLEIHGWYRAHVPSHLLHQVCCGGRYQPPGCGQICGCSTQLVSAEQYREFIAPLDDAVLSLYPNGGMIHLCGSHMQHAGTWRDMTSLRAIQVNDRAAMDLELYLRETPDKIYYVNPCEGMPADRIKEMCRGFKIVTAL